VVSPDTDHGERVDHSGVGELGGAGDLDNAHAGVVQLLDDRRCQRVATADDDVATHAHAHTRFAATASMWSMASSRSFRLGAESSGIHPPPVTFAFARCYDYRAPCRFVPAISPDCHDTVAPQVESQLGPELVA